MDQTADQIAEEIRQKRAALDENFQELEQKLRSLTDWKGQVRKHRGPLIAAALGVGYLVAKRLAAPSGSNLAANKFTARGKRRPH